MCKMRLKQLLKWYRGKVLGEWYPLLGRGVRVLGQKDPQTIQFCLSFCVLFLKMFENHRTTIDSPHLLGNRCPPPWPCSVTAFVGAVEESVKLLVSLGSEIEKKSWLWKEALTPWDRFALSTSFIRQILLKRSLVYGGAGIHRVESCLPGVCTALDVMVGIEVGKIRWAR